ELALEDWAANAHGRVSVCEPLAGGFQAAGAREAIASLSDDGRLLLVGHEPDMSMIVGELTGARIDLKKGGVAVVRLDEAGGGELVLLLRPRELALIAGGDAIPAGARAGGSGEHTA